MSDLQFQETIVDGPRRFRSFCGRNIDQMPLLLADGRVPLTPRQLLEERVHGKNVHDRDLLRDNHVDTACAVVTDNSGEVIIGLYSDPLVKELIHGLNPESRLQDSSLLVGADAYHEMKKNALVIPAGVAHDLRSNGYSHQTMQDAFWEYIAEGDADLVRDHLNLVQERRCGRMENCMGLWVSSKQGLRLLCAWSVGDDNGDAFGSFHPGYYFGGRLVGVVAPGAHQKLEETVRRA